MIGDDIEIIDPWDGFTGMMLQRYGGTPRTLERWIYGIRPFIKTNEDLAFAKSSSGDCVDQWPKKR